MKVVKSFRENKAVAIDEENLKYFDRFIGDFYSKRTYECFCNDKTRIEFKDITEVLEYENPNFRKIVFLEIVADNKSSKKYESEFRIQIGNRSGRSSLTYTTLEYSINSDDAKITPFENDLKERIKSFRPWYWLITQTSISTVIFWALMSISVLISLIERITNQSITGISTIYKKFDHLLGIDTGPASYSGRWWSIFFVSVFAIWVINYSFSRFKNFLFPKVVFLIGRQKKKIAQKYKVMYLIFEIIVLSILVNFFCNWIWDKYLKK